MHYVRLSVSSHMATPLVSHMIWVGLVDNWRSSRAGFEYIDLSADEWLVAGVTTGFFDCGAVVIGVLSYHAQNMGSPARSHALVLSLHHHTRKGKPVIKAGGTDNQKLGVRFYLSKRTSLTYFFALLVV
jgi:hypothetical protein